MSGALISDRVFVRRGGRGVHVSMSSLVGLVADTIPDPVAPEVTVTWADVTGKPASFPPSAHVHVIGDVTGLQAALDGKQPLATVLTNTTAAFTTAQETKLAGIATGATANAADSALRDRSTHTGTQAASTITGLATVATTGAYSDLSGRPSLFDGAYGSLSGVPATFPPSAHTHAIADVTGLQTALDSKAAASVGTDVGTLATEIEAARGDRSSLALRLATISNFASPNAGGVIVGRFYDNAFQGANSGTGAGAAGRVEMSPFYTSVRLRIDQIGVAVSTGVASSLLRCFIYGSDADGWPDELLYEGGADLSGATTNSFVFHTLDFTFDSGRQYWLGVRFSSTTTLRTIANGSMPNLGLAASNGSTYATMLRRTVAFATPLPASWGFVTGDLSAGNPSSVRMRAAAI